MPWDSGGWGFTAWCIFSTEPGHPQVEREAGQGGCQPAQLPDVHILQDYHMPCLPHAAQVGWAVGWTGCGGASWAVLCPAHPTSLHRGTFYQGYLCARCGVGAHKECLEVTPPCKTGKSLGLCWTLPGLSL